MKRIHIAVASVAMVLSLGAAEVGNIVVRQQWPWSTDIRVEYALTGVTTPVDIVVECYNGSTRLESASLASSLSGERFCLSADGVYVLTIDPVMAFGAGTGLFSDFKVKLTTADASAEMSEVLYKVISLTNQNSVTDIKRGEILNGKCGSFETDYSKIIPGSTVGNVVIWTEVTNNPIYKTTHLVMRRISAAGASFTMGAPAGELGQAWDGADYKDYERQHTVSFTNDFFIAVFPVTKYQHKLISNENVDNPSDVALRAPNSDRYFTTLRGYFVTNGKLGWWPDAGVWSSAGFVPNPLGSPHDLEPDSALYRLRQKSGIESMDLPTEARWEFCCRAGTSAATYAGDLTAASKSDPDPTVDQIAWYGQNSGGVVHEVGGKAPNPWGLYDMIGNVCEQCLDLHVSLLGTSAVVDPVGGPTPTGRYEVRSVRGGGASDINTYKFRAAFRGQTAFPHVASTFFLGYRPIFDVR